MSVFVLLAGIYDVDHDSSCEEEFAIQLARALQCTVQQTTRLGTFLIACDAAVPTQSSISVKCHAHGESKLVFELVANDESQRESDEFESPQAMVAVGEANVRIYGESVLQRIPFGASAARWWSPIALSTDEMVAYGITDAKKVLEGAQLTVCSGSVILEVRNTLTNAHAERVVEWALTTPMLAEVVEAAVMRTTLQPLLYVKFFAHSLLRDEGTFVRRDDWFLAEPILVDSMADASGNALPGMIQRATQALFSKHTSSVDDLFVLFTSPSLPFVNELAPSTVFWDLLVRSCASNFKNWRICCSKTAPKLCRFN